MKAVVYREPFEPRSEKPRIPMTQDPTANVSQLTSRAICWSDLHTHESWTGAQMRFTVGLYSVTRTKHRAERRVGETSEAGRRAKDRSACPFAR